MSLIEDLPICNLRKTDLKNIVLIIEDHIESGEYWGRKDYWEMSIKRITEWLDKIEYLAYQSDMKTRGE